MAIKDLPREEYVLEGNASCPGCPITIALRTVLKALGKNTILTIPASCSAVIQSLYPKTSFNVPTLNVAFETAAASASGIVASLQAQGREDITVVAWAGDGGSYDIGLQALSGALERGTNFLYICYNNQMYSNTGIQRSGATPYGAWTTTTWTGKKERQKVLAEIVMAHHIPYVATASIAYPEDLYQKTKKAQGIRGPKYMEIIAPCPPGWRFDMSKTVELARLAVETGAWLLYEFENEKLTFTGPTRAILEGDKEPASVEDWLRMQGRFRNLTTQDLETFKQVLQERWDHYRKLASL
ncbi:MAG: 3-methyl-2-oxobutanoate dehydrogenase subunit beta [Candidatus Thermoplasmatota archaeon]|nr:3-methyl-2-oxobutanoate dehydrogenase subunit beta [Candidatus Thermoplasmatota archaeon]